MKLKNFSIRILRFWLYAFCLLASDGWSQETNFGYFVTQDCRTLYFLRRDAAYCIQAEDRPGMARGEYRWDGTNWVSTGTGAVDPSANVTWTGTHTFRDNNFSILDNSDPSKILKFELSPISTGTTRTLTVPNASGTLPLLEIANSYTAGAKQTFTHSGTTAGMRINPATGDPSSPADGDVWYNSSTGKFRKRQAGSTTDLDSTGGTPAFSDVIAGTNVNALVIGTGGSLGVSGSGTIVATSLAANGTNCAGGQAPTGVDASGNAEGCQAVGPGTVTSFSSGNLSPLFTSSVASPTTTPALTFSLTNQIANTGLFGPTSGGAAAPTFRLLVKADLPATGVFNDQANTYTGGNKQSFTHSATTAGLRLVPVAGDPTTPLDGDMIYNATTSKFRCYENGVWTNCIGAGGSTATLQTAFDGGKTITNANSFANGVHIGAATTTGWRIYEHATNGPTINCVIGGVENDCDYTRKLNSGKHIKITRSDGTDLERLTEAGVHTYTGVGKPLKSVWFGAGSLSTDGTQCAAPAEVTINSGAKMWTIICTDNDASTIYGLAEMPDAYDGGTVTLMGSFIQTAADTANMNSDVAMACRGDGLTINNTWGTEVAMDTAMTGSNAIDTVTTGAITPNGTCTGGGKLLQFRWQLDATGTTTAVATLHVVGFKLEYSVNSRSD
jgi:hypothetical protein